MKNETNKTTGFDINNPDFFRIKNFVLKFFVSIEANVKEEGERIEISNVNECFEKVYGKKSPYKFCFNKEYSRDSEFVEKGNYLLTAISNYLENTGKTTLLKIDLDDEPGEKEVRKKLKLKECEIEKMTKKKRFDFFYRFSFQTNFQYLNQREQVINDVYIYKGKVINGDLNNYSVTDGKKEEVTIPNTKEDYLIAKEEAKKLLKDKTEKIASDLNGRLDKEVKRIEEHFLKETSEFNETYEKNIQRLKLLEKEKPSKELENKLVKQRILIDSLKKKNFIEDYEKNKLREIKLEEQKHALNINTKLINTTLIYYPLYCFDVYVKNDFAKRILEVCVDPLTGKMDEIFCESCNENLEEVFLCSSNHLSCNKCLDFCEVCRKNYCKKCLKKVCNICNKKICDDCAVRCFGCGKIVCKDHSKMDKLSERVYCKNCLKKCERCGTMGNPRFFKESPRTGIKICEECYRKEIQEKTINKIFLE